MRYIKTVNAVSPATGLPVAVNIQSYAVLVTDVMAEAGDVGGSTPVPARPWAVSRYWAARPSWFFRSYGTEALVADTEEQERMLCEWQDGFTAVG